MHDGLYDAECKEKLPIRIGFIGLWCAADREGRFKWEPRRLGAQILPYDDVDFSRVLDALVTRGFIVKYQINALTYGAIPSWKKHQIINNRERESEIPNFAEDNVLHDDLTRDPRVTHASKAEGKGMERNGCIDHADLQSAEIEPIYQAYPRKIGKGAALKAISKALDRGHSQQLLVERAQAYAAATATWPAEDRQFIPHPATWFSQDRFLDDPSEWSRKPQTNGQAFAGYRTKVHYD